MKKDRLFLNEEITPVKVIALVMMIYALILQKEDGGEKGKALFYILCVSVFILNGGCSIVSKIHQVTERFNVVSADGFVFLRNVFESTAKKNFKAPYYFRRRNNRRNCSGSDFLQHRQNIKQ